MPRIKPRVRSRNASLSKKSRSQYGLALIEMLIAILVLSFLMIGVMDAMAKARRQSTALQNQAVAANIAQELMDAARNQNFAMLQTNLGTKTLSGQYVNRTIGGALTGGVTYLPRPLVLDTTTNTYTSPDTAVNMFRGNVTQNISQLDANTLHLSITVNWPDEHGAGMRALVQSTIVTQNGIHN